MDKIVSVLSSFVESDEADKKYYQSLTPDERLQILLALNRRWPANDIVQTTEGLERVYRITEFP